MSGPNWLDNQLKWPTWSVTQFKSCQTLLTYQTEENINQSLVQSDISSVIDITRYRWSTLKRVTAVVFSLLENFKLKDRTRKSWNRNPLSVAELARAENVWIRLFQKRHFKEEIQYFESKRKSWRPAIVSQFDLFVDPEGIVRCGGRFANAHMKNASKNPVLSPKNSELARLIITSVHERIFHFGVDSTLAQLQQQYWIPSFRRQVQIIVRACSRCRRDSGPVYRSPDPAPLPEFRVKLDYPFAVMGVDYTGAITTRDKKSREESLAYVLLMTCGGTRAVHLEVVPDMTTESFFNAFRRYTGHHPLPKVIMSDNASTFVSASGEMVNIYSNPQLSNFLTDRNIQWKFIPKRAPWYGGFWERLIGITKEALRKTVGRTKLSMEELITSVTEIEAFLNDRKLTVMPSDVDGIQPLTPSHLLYGQRLTSLPFYSILEEEMEDPSYNVSPSILSKSYIRNQNIVKTFKRQWLEVYMPSLRKYHQKTNGKFEDGSKWVTSYKFTVKRSGRSGN